MVGDIIHSGDDTTNWNICCCWWWSTVHLECWGNKVMKYYLTNLVSILHFHNILENVLELTHRTILVDQRLSIFIIRMGTNKQVAGQATIYT